MGMFSTSNEESTLKTDFYKPVACSAHTVAVHQTRIIPQWIAVHADGNESNLKLILQVKEATARQYILSLGRKKVTCF